ncbi:MAG: hypothetical protein PGMFKBFP_00211 [Anaerolineales bacterium]|nr:hypothetical protein [Anaerolineales bacterium]
MVAGDDHVNFFCARFDGLLDFLDSLRERGLPRGKTCRDGRHGDARSLQRVDGVRDAIRVDADRGDSHPLSVQAEAFEHVGADRLFGFRAQALDAPGRVVSAEGGQIDAGDGAQQPGGLPFFFHGAAAGEGGNAPLCRALVDARAHYPVQVEGRAGVAIMVRSHGRSSFFIWGDYTAKRNLFPPV